MPDYLNFLAEAELKAVDPDQCLDMDDSEADDLEDIPDRVAAVLIGLPETEATQRGRRIQCQKKLDQNQQMSQGGTAPRSRQVTPHAERSTFHVDATKVQAARLTSRIRRLQFLCHVRLRPRFQSSLSNHSETTRVNPHAKTWQTDREAT